MRYARRLIPDFFFNYYHYALAFLGALIYRFPSSKLTVIAVTGTKGKSTTVELVNAILEESGFKTAIAGTIRFKIGNKSRPNLYKMTMPGRFFLQKFLRQAVDSGCRYAVLEMTSEGVRQFRHKYIELDALIFTNIAPEHIESHGSFEKYLEAKLKLVGSLARSTKKRRIMVANADDAQGKTFLAAAGASEKFPFRLADAKPFSLTEKGIDFTFASHAMHSPLIGEFNLMNILAATTLANSYDISSGTIARALGKVRHIPGRVEFVSEGQPFKVVVDYAHTPDSLHALFEAFKNKRLVCIIGSTGGGRDTWNRPQKGTIADQYCDVSIITDEDPYDEDPEKIVAEIAKGFSKHKPEIIMDRREAIRKAISLAKADDAVLITGKGTDPYMMTARGRKIPWSDTKIAREELRAMSGHG
ncbi:hypothetical protein A3D66_01785 [Candidatus Kaiserbacteria bacterium RIFCSPHIGHO2_02_FULL_50_9]|uniref:UDP-N-acetylmuramyl-tripeptide synthetase n=1 Tax=Candidatus Kaiserbacteria bacterium RIFCSPLOWO2_01_FULL_51_21 TaxID=1798508 RepID=A0A1F6ED94_9BACT|nr:MAG: hypothetical protein A2761_02430 [Candidatus Kaiserbacteria bacterium RIFCSPHIGHO2_01_FULL_51_33]OGG63758.1 MAG: hypothetical protein A3D66_01785 [Candidatus Kaiserbacteria bacterium RIFCSPHIGHO2_02_FULL_50_9]OGG71639.1 MAG: hypothetical protein A3A35_00520 [Candidatus Kaiserbacteria bacterium RIFCSPLOWO2_01_FULL_51_21]